MKKFWIDFSGYGVIEAENERDAEKRFWDFVDVHANNNGIILDDVWDLECVEEIIPSATLAPVSIGTSHDWEEFWRA